MFCIVGLHSFLYMKDGHLMLKCKVCQCDVYICSVCLNKATYVHQQISKEFKNIAWHQMCFHCFNDDMMNKSNPLINEH